MTDLMAEGAESLTKNRQSTPDLHRRAPMPAAFNDYRMAAN